MKCLFCELECGTELPVPWDAKIKCNNHAPLTVTFVQDTYFIIQNGEYKVVVYYDDYYKDYMHRFTLYHKSKRILSSNTVPTITPQSFEDKIRKLMMFS